jgi:trk system potassium uptake protein TrkH
MNLKMMGKFISQIVAIEAVFMIPALVISLCYGESAAARGFLVTLGIIVLLTGVLYLTCRKADRIFGAREGLVCVGFSWIILSLLGCIPFVISGNIPHFIADLRHQAFISAGNIDGHIGNTQKFANML